MLFNLSGSKCKDEKGLDINTNQNSNFSPQIENEEVESKNLQNACRLSFPFLSLFLLFPYLFFIL